MSISLSLSLNILLSRRNEASHDIRHYNCKGTGERTHWDWLLKSKLKAHHKINLRIRPLTQCFHNGSAFYYAETVVINYTASVKRM